MKNILALWMLFLLAGSACSQAVLYATDFGNTGTTGGTLLTGWTAGGAVPNNLLLSASSVSSSYSTPVSASGGANLADDGNTNGISTAVLSGMVNTSGYSSIRILFGVRATSTYTNSVPLEWSKDGITWNTIVYTAPPLDGNWYLANNTWIDLPSGAENQPDLMFRFTFNRTNGTSKFRIDDFTVIGTLTGGPTSPTDYFRSKNTGDWNIAATWESSNDNISWVTASIAPTSSANTITIRAAHTITISSTISADQLIIDAGGNLVHNSGIIFNLNNGVGEDMMINGSYTLHGTMPAGTGTVLLQTPGASVFVNGNTGGESDNFAYSSRVTFKTDTYFYWSVSTIFETVNVTYFPNSTSNDHPSFIINANVGAVGSASQTTFNGYFDVRGNITFQNGGTKIFRDGIITTTNKTLTQDVSSGVFIMNGTGVKFGGLGLINLNSTAGLELSNGSTADMTSSQRIDGSTFFVKGVLKTYEWQLSGSAGIDVAGTIYTSHANGISSAGTFANTGTNTLISGSTIVFDRASAAGNQQLTSRSDYWHVQIEGGSKKIVNGPATVNGLLTLNSGIIVSTATNLFIISATGSVNGASAASFISGPVKKIGNTAFIFPVGRIIGSENHYRFIAISAPGNSTDAFTAEFIRSDAYLKGSISAIAKTNGLYRVSRCEYWSLKRESGSSNVSVTLSWNSQSPCNSTYVTDPSKIVAAQFNGTQWGDLFGGTGVGTNTTGTVTWNGAQIYDFFSLGSMDFLENPLPLNVSSFTAKSRKTDILLNWNSVNADLPEEYILEHSNDGKNFAVLRTISVKPTLASYEAADEKPFTGWNYYRLRTTDKRLHEQVSNIIRVWFGVNEVIRISPNPATEKIVIILPSPRSISGIELVNIAGQVLKKVNMIQFQTEINISQLQAGMYYLRITGPNGTMIKTFVRE